MKASKETEREVEVIGPEDVARVAGKSSVRHQSLSRKTFAESEPGNGFTFFRIHQRSTVIFVDVLTCWRAPICESFACVWHLARCECTLLFLSLGFAPRTHARIHTAFVGFVVAAVKGRRLHSKMHCSCFFFRKRTETKATDSKERRKE